MQMVSIALDARRRTVQYQKPNIKKLMYVFIYILALTDYFFCNVLLNVVAVG